MPRKLNVLILGGAVVLLALGVWQCSPTNRDDLCTKLSALQEIRNGDIKAQQNGLSRAARNYRGERADAVRKESSAVAGIKGAFIQPSSLDNATVAIRGVCGAPSFGK